MRSVPALLPPGLDEMIVIPEYGSDGANVGRQELADYHAHLLGKRFGHSVAISARKLDHHLPC